jgi:hypothetical protein
MNDTTINREELLEGLNWRYATAGTHPTQPGLISDLDQPGYFKTRKL